MLTRGTEVNASGQAGTKSERVQTACKLKVKLGLEGGVRAVWPRAGWAVIGNGGWMGLTVGRVR